MEYSLLPNWIKSLKASPSVVNNKYLGNRFIIVVCKHTNRIRYKKYQSFIIKRLNKFTGVTRLKQLQFYMAIQKQ
jgi:hypothetical protein